MNSDLIARQTSQTTRMTVRDFGAANYNPYGSSNQPIGLHVPQRGNFHLSPGRNGRSKETDSLSHNNRPSRMRVVLKVFKNTCERWCLAIEDQAYLLALNSEYHFNYSVGRLGESAQDQSQAIIERGKYVISISVGLGILFLENAEEENNWLRCERLPLDGKTPLAYMLKGRFCDIERVLRLVEHDRGL